MRAWISLLILLSLTLAGCSDDGGDDPTDPTPTDPVNPTDPDDEEPNVNEGEPGTRNGTVTAHDDTYELTLTTVASGAGSGSASPNCIDLTPTNGTVTPLSVYVEVAWNSQGPNTDILEVVAIIPGEFREAVTGNNPFNATFDVPPYGSEPGLIIGVQSQAPGIAIQQSVNLRLVMEYGGNISPTTVSCSL